MGNVNLFHTRRGYNIRCRYWVRDETADNSIAPSEWVVRNQPSGLFYAKDASSAEVAMQQIHGVWALDSESKTIETNDSVRDLIRGCIVEADGERWIVTSTQFTTYAREMEFSRAPGGKTLIRMRRAPR